MSIWSGSTVLLTGGTGSLGQAMTRLLLAEQPHSIRIFARGEHRQDEMRRRFNDPRLRLLTGDVRDADRVLEAMESVDIVIHAAALKRVDGSEQQAAEAVKTNALGAINVVRAAQERGVARAVCISSDKAAGAVTLYGATKLIAEQLFLAPHGRCKTVFAAVRYGNVAASAGSIIPLFLAQRSSGRVTITDARCTRFWITLGQAARWIKRRIELLEPGCIYVPVLPSVRVIDVARAVAPQAEVAFIGLRGTEKIHETMIAWDESRRARLVWDPDTLNHYVLGPDLVNNEEFEYRSDANGVPLSVEEIRAALPGALQEAGYEGMGAAA